LKGKSCLIALSISKQQLRTGSEKHWSPILTPKAIINEKQEALLIVISFGSDD
jgi:hypothetical protein